MAATGATFPQIDSDLSLGTGGRAPVGGAYSASGGWLSARNFNTRILCVLMERGMWMMKRFGVSVLCVALAGCYSQHSLPSAGEPVASMTFLKSYDNRFGQIAGASQSYLSIEGDSCKSLTKFALFGWSDGASKTRPIRAGERITVYGEISETLASGAVSSTVGTCVSGASFTPIAGEAYSIRQIFNAPNSCNIEIVDKSGARPADYRAIDVPRCG
ncbi:hypothetical protein [Sphingomonas sp.]|jgi:hypothetical protein|uniref:hypothetical protein n=1 Tax=Sphingomonas sp. TaxID=28214 RepID=UPI002E1609BA|nr:hypothetical protein [Sphingomonas sp.]